MIEVIALIILTLICAGLIVERYFYTKEMNRELKDCRMALMSRNIFEYNNAKMVDRTMPEPVQQPDEVPIEEADEELFNKHLHSDE